jgi:hypothetical protein
LLTGKAFHLVSCQKGAHYKDILIEIEKNDISSGLILFDMIQLIVLRQHQLSPSFEQTLVLDATVSSTCYEAARHLASLGWKTPLIDVPVMISNFDLGFSDMNAFSKLFALYHAMNAY